jgi:hypothetical protein
MSFGFKVVKDEWPARDRRNLLDVDLLDVSVVTYPAYPSTSISVRCAGESVDFTWYAGDERSIVIPEPDVTEQERLRLKLRLARQI